MAMRLFTTAEVYGCDHEGCATEIHHAECQRCNGEVDSGDAFCRYCGLDFGQDLRPPVVTGNELERRKGTDWNGGGER